MFFRGQTIGKYRILSSLGSGGFGTVYLAEDTMMKKKVALKVPHKQNVNLLKEAQLLASMSHPNIVSVLTAEKPAAVVFIVMEYVPGETLESLILREGVLDLTRAMDFSCQICNAVGHAHDVGILHRDIRPGNMLVTEGGMLKVSDFGTSRYLEIAAHGTTVIGSPPYMAPEQFYGKAVFASDIYSVGVTMYQMFTGTMPYDTPTPRDITRLARGEMLSAPRIKNPKIPKAINDIVLRAMAPEPTDRYQKSSDPREAQLAAREPAPRRHAGRGGTVPACDNVDYIKSRLRAGGTPPARFCWDCRRAMQARTDRCPFCNEAQ